MLVNKNVVDVVIIAGLLDGIYVGNIVGALVSILGLLDGVFVGCLDE